MKLTLPLKPLTSHTDDCNCLHPIWQTRRGRYCWTIFTSHRQMHFAHLQGTLEGIMNTTWIVTNIESFERPNTLSFSENPNKCIQNVCEFVNKSLNAIIPIEEWSNLLFCFSFPSIYIYWPCHEFQPHSNCFKRMLSFQCMPHNKLFI